MFACVPDVAHANEVLLSLTRSTSKCVAMSPFVVHASKRDREMTCAAQAARGGAEEEQGAGWSFTSRNHLRLQG